MAINAPPPKIKTSHSDHMVYIGRQRKSVIQQMTIEISYKTKIKIQTAMFFQYLLDKYADQAKDEFIAELLNEDKP